MIQETELQLTLWNRVTAAQTSSKSKLQPATLEADLALEIRKYHSSFPQYRETPLAELSQLANSIGIQNLFVKDESHRFGLNAFKVLGGSYAIGRLIGDLLNWTVSELSYDHLMTAVSNGTLPAMTFVTATDGNHGRGVAWTASTLGQRSVVYMPEGSSQERLEHIIKEGAEASILPMNYDEAVRLAARMAEEKDWLLIQDTAWDGYETIPTWVMQGYMTMALEAYEQMTAKSIKPTHLFLQAGVGSMAAAVSGFFRSVMPDETLKIIIVESDQADCLYKTATANDGELKIVTGKMQTLMAGLACGEPSTVGWEILKQSVDGFISCNDAVTLVGMQQLGTPQAPDVKVISGESGAVGVGALLALMTSSRFIAYKEALGLNEESVVLMFSTEGDTDSQSYEKILKATELNL